MNERIGYTAHIAPKRIVVLPLFDRQGGRSYRPKQNSLDNLKKRKQSLEMSRAMQRRVMDSVNWLIYSSPWKKIYSKKWHSWSEWKVGFITLTMPSSCVGVSLKDFNEKMLRPWLTNMQRNYGLKLYVWKCEQQENGVWHAHITMNTFLHKTMIMRTWNALMKRRGYLDAYYKDNGNYDPPSTKVHAVRKIRDIGAYIAKYISKNSFDSKMQAGRLWGCSYELSRVRDTRAIFGCTDDCSPLSWMVKNIKEQKEILSKTTAGTKGKWLGNLFFPKARQWLVQELGDIKNAFDDAVMYLRSGYEAVPLIAYS
jgi:hypothetical protein